MITCDGPCDIWTGSLDKDGYGRIKRNGMTYRAHRIAYEEAKGPIPDGLQLDHLCRVRNCINPDHLEAVTCQENIRRGELGAAQRARTHCPQNHPYSGDNLYIDPRGDRQCRICRYNQLKAWRERHVVS